MDAFFKTNKVHENNYYLYYSIYILMIHKHNFVYKILMKFIKIEKITIYFVVRIQKKCPFYM